ncbi:unnamed protein product, partial [Ixodes pacificus]
RLEYTGSYYDGLRIKKADEFDINLVLNLPFEKDEFTVSFAAAPVGLSRCLTWRSDNHRLLLINFTYIDGIMGLKQKRRSHSLIPDRVTRWLESVLSCVLRTYVVPSGPCSAMEKVRGHGPAVTLYIKLKDGNQIDVDLVPVIEFRHPSWPTGVQKKGWMANMLPEDCNWFLIPKSPKPKSHLWRLHFPNMEKRLIEDQGCVKPIICLLKVLDRLGDVLAQPGPAISFLFHPEVDLTETVTRKTRDNISGQIKHIVRKLWLSPDQCYELVLKNQRKDRA